MAEKWQPTESMLSNIKAAIKARGLTQDAFYDVCKQVSRSTLQKFMAGNGSPATYGAILKSLKISDPDFNIGQDIASEDLGRYDRSRVRGYEGNYTYVRPAFHNPLEICAFPVTMAWSETKTCLVLKAKTEYDYEVEALIHFPAHRSLHITDIEQGQCSLTIISHVNSGGHLFGLMLTLGWSGRGDNWSPMCVPVVFTQDRNLTAQELVKLSPGQDRYDKYLELLSRVKADGFGDMVWAGANPG